MIDEIELDELERRIRDKWLTGVPRPLELDPEAMAVARKLMDRGSAQRFARVPRGGRFRYRAPIVTAEYYFVPPTVNFYGMRLSEGGWVFNMLEDGRKRSTTPGLTEGKCLEFARLLAAKGIRVRRFVTEQMRQGEAGTTSGQRPNRRAIMDQLAEYRP